MLAGTIYWSLRASYVFMSNSVIYTVISVCHVSVVNEVSEYVTAQQFRATLTI